MNSKKIKKKLAPQIQAKRKGCNGVKLYFLRIYVSWVVNPKNPHSSSKKEVNSMVQTKCTSDRKAYRIAEI